MKDLTNIVGYIYKITSPNDKYYIGQTLNYKKRILDYKNKWFKKQIKLWNNCEYYNWNPSEKFEIIEECLCGKNKCNLNERERYWILYYDSFKNGLNCNEGGEGNIGYKHTEETYYDGWRKVNDIKDVATKGVNKLRKILIKDYYYEYQR